MKEKSLASFSWIFCINQLTTNNNTAIADLNFLAKKKFFYLIKFFFYNNKKTNKILIEWCCFDFRVFRVFCFF